LDIFGLTFTILHRKVVKAQLKIIKFPLNVPSFTSFTPLKINMETQRWRRFGSDDFPFEQMGDFQVPRPSRSTSPGRKQAPKCWVISVEFDVEVGAIT